MAREPLRINNDYRDELTVENGIVLKGEATLVPKTLRNDIKKRAHASHLGYDSTMKRLKGTFSGLVWLQKSNKCVKYVNLVRN